MYCSNCATENDNNAEDCRSCGAPLHKEPCATIEYAGFWKRAAAVLIDSFILLVVGTALGMAIIIMTGSEHGVEQASNFIGPLMGWLYFSLMESSTRQATIGKKILGIIVTDSKGQRITFYRASGRHFAKLVSLFTLGFGFFMVSFTKKHQTLHDLMFDCLVVIKKP